MTNLSQRERDAKVKATQNIINDAIWTMGTPSFNTHDIAERIINEIERVEIEFDEYYHEASLTNAERTPF